MDVTSTQITYDIGAYAQLNEQLRIKPELYLDRYFVQQFYACAIAGKRKHEAESTDAETKDEAIPREWQYVRMSPNKLCVIGLAGSHPLLDPEQRKHIEVTKVEFADNVKNSVIKGKRKKQSLRLMPNTKLCTIHTADGKEYAVRAAVKGVLMEWNGRLESDPSLVTRCPEQGFVAIIKPSTDDNQKIFSECVSSV
ncbi:hypothetical protein GGH12_001032 [Coemansia sp. RSA 1822]|nr:hypothetical protein LPJ76_000103 [Coemansia sp. RSA 638]KAJ2125690.1 hypothetical protein IW147_000750 [Coemansia sp. RSA 720]KAJ2566125.1 hypothetical protein GGH12_001032 [Coemansia sp. RSA 1822]KAJ2667162.1 hypothetical protein IW148_000263 [Coemansia sp. RSA 1199]